MNAIVIGCGRVGSSLAERLTAEGHRVSVIDKNPKARLLLPKNFPGRFLVGNGFSRTLLEEVGIKHADAFIAVTSGDNSNIVGARIAKEVYRVPRVVARIYDPRRADIYSDLGIPTVANVRWTVERVHQLLFHRDLDPDQTLGDGESLLVRSPIPDYLDGRPVDDLEVDGEIRVVEILRRGQSRIPGRATALQAGDVLWFAVAATSLGRLGGFLGRELGT